MKRPDAILAILVALAGAPVLAATSDRTEDAEQRRLMAAFNDRSDPITLSLHAGISRYTLQLGEATRAGPALGLRVAAERWGLVSAELGYEHSRNAVAAAEGALSRDNLTVLAKGRLNVAGRLRAFLGAGLGLSYVRRSRDAPAPFRDDLLQEIPLAAGLEYRLGWATAGVRATYSALFNDDFMAASADGGNPPGGLLTTSLSVGGRF